VISDEVWGKISAHCSFGRVEGKACGEAKSSFRIGDIDRYNIYAPVCLESGNGSLHSSGYVRFFLNKFIFFFWRNLVMN
jgi:serine carboxypeptidase-like clade 2